ncbi:endothelial differentiation-related factor 1 [Strongylocentrotus purpuratus]|uniref:HTH cro/C1-type domain-containing protein n=1 Tax=Strongylocentrotus purpuratus TaxID=7668 RepID=A0A7M7RH88_STRPU|nr:endothelial differentiation-related factor 1 [Strongylocentrotus purpuratus]|eukprot:XP_788121.2 PREDICTED: endothelial differentiation-related factor 1 [Strongylocentrotus purpuratus]
MAEDWDTVTYLRRKAPSSKQARSSKAVNSALRQGQQVDTNKKFSAGTNKQKSASKNTAKLDRETEELHHEHVSLDVGKVMQRGRQDKNLTQKELATKINEKQQVINEYESGKAVTNNQVLAKIERVLGVKLRGKDIGQPTGGKKK